MLNNKLLVDSHCHLNSLENLELVISRAAEFGVGYMHTICTKLSEFEEILEIANRYPNIWASVGVHPHEVDKEDVPSITILESLAQNQRVISLGETGLDYYYEYSNRLNQQQSFINHIIVARKLSKPVIVHTRDAKEDSLRILSEEYRNGPFKAVIHCFSEDEEFAQEVLNLGMYISISGIATFKKAENLRNIIAHLPLDRILVETDSPFLAPVPMRGKTNEPGYTYYVSEEIAKIKNLDIADVIKATTINFQRLFAI